MALHMESPKYTEARIEKGRTSGQADIVLKQLTLRFGALSEDVIARVKAAPSEDLQRFAERVLTAQTLDEILA